MCDKVGVDEPVGGTTDEERVPGSEKRLENESRAVMAEDADDCCTLILDDIFTLIEGDGRPELKDANNNN